MGKQKSQTSSLRKAARELLPEGLRARVMNLVHPSRKSPDSKPGSYKGKSTFTVVAAAYNVGSYLDDFFSSIFNQTIDESSLRIIIVDDGSTDNTANVVRHWQEKRPEGIAYMCKENGGQASARNTGLEHVETEWVTFIDPDDFVSRRYFEDVDRAIENRPDLALACCKLVYYRMGASNRKRFRDTHPLDWRFDDDDLFFSAGDENVYPQLSASTAFFRLSEIKRQGLRFSEKIRPTFEDAHFVGRYLCGLEQGSIGFLPRPCYYYRKRADASSALDRSWQNEDMFLTRTREGYLDLLEQCERIRGRAPKNIQLTILYDWNWFLKRLLDRPERWAHLSKSQRRDAFEAWREAMAKIDFDVLMDAPEAILGREGKFFTAGLFFPERHLHPHLVIMRNVNMAKQTMLVEVYGEGISFLAGKSTSEVSKGTESTDGLEALMPVEEKRVGHIFLDAEAPDTHMLWLAWESEREMLTFQSQDSEDVEFIAGEKRFENSATVGAILGAFTEHWGDYPQTGNLWLIMDRDTQADDNGEHFCRWMLTHHPEQNIVFALRKNAPRWDILKAEGFPLVDFGSIAFKIKLRACSKIISSHADTYVHSYFGNNFHHSKDFVFLQHGVTKDDVSGWLNPKPITLMITATPQERGSIVSDGTHYRLTPRQVALTGFPRHDALLEAGAIGSDTSEIVIMPTWRNNLAGKALGKGNERSLSPDFDVSEYKCAWEAFLKSQTLRDLANNGTTIVFFPHANMLPYVQEGRFNVPSYIELGTCEKSSIQDYIVKANCMITDYTSVAFEAAYLGKPVIYYQFDRKEFFSGEQVFARGYFDYERDGFGPVVQTLEGLEEALGQLVSRDFEPEAVYAKRMADAFPFRDSKCCERVYEAIRFLDEPDKSQ